MSLPRESRKREAKRPRGSLLVERLTTEADRFVPPRLALVALVGIVVIVYARLFAAAFVDYDDDVLVYANPLLNPLSYQSLGQLWRHADKGLYNPLSSTIWGVLGVFGRVATETRSSLGQPITLDPAVFHTASIGFHVANTVLCFMLALRLTRGRVAALLCALVFAVHPLQVESVGWVSQLRGLSSGFFGLAALNLLVRSRQVSEGSRASSRAAQAASAALVLGAMLCKPSAVVLPVVALVVDRVAIGTAWRRALTTALTWSACVLPLALINWSVHPTYPQGASLWWQRPFVAGDALAFYLFKTVVPTDLGVEYGRTPHSVLAVGWGYATWVVPLGLLLLCFVYRRRRPLAWLGALWFVIFFLPVSGLVPFAFQAHSTVADRYAYLSLVGVGLVVAESVVAVRSRMVTAAAGLIIILLGVRSFDQTSYWLDNVSFLRHTLEVNADVAFAQTNLANILLKEQRVDEAIQHLEKALELDPGHAVAHNNLALILVQQGLPNEAEPHFQKAVELDPRFFKAFENLGALYLRANRFADAIASLTKAIEIHPEAKALNDLGIAFMQSGHSAEGLDAFQRAVAGEPSNAQYRKNLGTALAQLGRTEEAVH